MSTAIQISTTVEFIQANTTTNRGTILLPSTTAMRGRILTIKDTAGRFAINPLTLSTNRGDTFENGGNIKTLVEQYGYLTLASDGISKWYFLDGTSLNTYTINSLENDLGTSTLTISSQTTSVSTLGFVDRSFNTISSIYARSTLLYLGSNVIGGSKVSPTLYLPMRASFTPNQISGLAAWYDGADQNTLAFQNNIIPIWRDKSGANRNAVQGTQTNQPTYNTGTNDIQLFNPRFFNMTNMPSEPYDIFVVGTSLASVSDYRTLFRTSPTDPGMNPIVLEGGTNNLGWWNGFSFLQFGTLTWAPNTKNLLFARMNATKTMQASLNGTISLTAETANSGQSAVILFMGGLLLSGVYQGQAWGSVNEVIFYTTPLITSQRQQIEGYLAWKWGLVGNLPASHPFKNSPP